jgi:Cd2+/Zn2+-exporting ATPase
MPGRGAQAMVDDRLVVVGSDRLLAELGADAASLAQVESIAAGHAAHGRSMVSVGIAEGGSVRVAGVIAVADRVRPAAKDILGSLRQTGVRHMVMLTGDRDVVAQSIAAEVGIDAVRAELLPQDKTAAIEDLRQTWGSIAMIGDGVNDAPALAAADVGIAMGIAGADAALESADLALMNDDLGALERLFDLSRRTLSVIKQNVALSLVTKALALVLGAFGFVTLWIAVLLDVGTSLLVTLNGLRLAQDVPVAIREQAIATVDTCDCCGDHDHDHAHAA